MVTEGFKVQGARCKEMPEPLNKNLLRREEMS
jgi:hypothetical protein